MNIFALDNDPTIAAVYHSDKHVIKMVLETAQILSTVHHTYGSLVSYKPTHQKHPCTIWAGVGTGNYKWLQALGIALCLEYTKRYGKVHACEFKLRGELAQPPEGLFSGDITPFALAMPDECKRPDPIEAYRIYYQRKTTENTWMRWDKLGNTPDWIVVRTMNTGDTK